MKDYTADICVYIEKVKKVIDTLNTGEINRFINLLCEAREKGKQIFIMGNGGTRNVLSLYVLTIMFLL